MNVKPIPCGPVVNASERKAIDHLETCLKAEPGDDKWLLLTNLSFSTTHQHPPAEIDIVAIGPQGVRVIEVKHWDLHWMSNNPEIVQREAERLIGKVRKVNTSLRRVIPQLNWADGVFLVTRDAKESELIEGNKLWGVQCHTLKTCQGALGLGLARPQSLSPDQVETLGKTLYPNAGVAIDGELSHLGDYDNLKPLTPEDERFHRIYRGIRDTPPEPEPELILLHLYDVSATDEQNPENRARREWAALHRLQLYPWAPRIVDSFQPAPGYAGEMWFFTVSDPRAPSVEEYAADDGTWSTKARLVFARRTVTALMELHKAGEGGKPMLHRNLTPETIRVTPDNTPLLTDFRYARIPGKVTVAGTGGGEDRSNAVAPEILKKGLGAADRRSDVYSLCASLSVLFAKRDDDKSREASRALAGGKADDPADRTTLENLFDELSVLLGEVTPHPIRWGENQNQIVNFRDWDYRIVELLDSGGVGTTFKVMRIDRKTGKESGPFVAKTVEWEETGRRVLQAYDLVRPHLAGSGALSTIFEIANEWHENNFVALMQWIEGKSLSDLVGDFHEEQVLHWLRTVCEALGVLHINGLIHGDVSLGNLIVNGDKIVLTDYDFVAKIGEPVASAGTPMYSSLTHLKGSPAESANDFFALGASVFHMLFKKMPFMYGDSEAKERGLNWNGVKREDYPTVAAFLEQATNLDPAKRFTSADDAIAALDTKKSGPSIDCTSVEIEEGSVCLGTDTHTNTDVHWQLTTKENHSLLIAGSPKTGKTTCLLNLCRQMVATGIQPIVFSDNRDIDEGLKLAEVPFRHIGFGEPKNKPLLRKPQIDPLAVLIDSSPASVKEIVASSELIIIRAHAKLQQDGAGVLLWHFYKHIKKRDIQDRITHALIFDETHSAFNVFLKNYMAQGLWKYGISLVLALQRARIPLDIPNYLVLRLAEEDAESFVKDAPDSEQRQVWSNEIQQMEQFKALYFCEGESQPYSVKLSS